MQLTKAFKIANASGTMLGVELSWLAEQASHHDVIVEVGSWTGSSTRALAENTSGVVYAVDTWDPPDMENYEHVLRDKEPDWLYKKFLENMKGLSVGKVVPVKMLSLEAVEYLKGKISSDMVFIDASHDYANVKADILAWRSLLVGGGLLCGHDYDVKWPGVIRAVNELLPSRRIVAGRIWAIWV